MDFLLPFILLSIGGAFEHEQAVHAKNFKGESQTFRTILWISVYTSWITRIAIVAYIALNLSWVAAIAIFTGRLLVSGLLAGIVSGVLRRAVGSIAQLYISFAAFVVWPSCYLAAYLVLPG